MASVSCIYSLGDPIDYRSMVISLRPGMQMERDDLCKKLVTLQYERNDINFIRNKFRVHGDTVDIYLAKELIKFIIIGIAWLSLLSDIALIYVCLLV